MAAQSSRESGQGKSFQEDFYRLCPGARSFFELFEHLPFTLFYAKDIRHRYIGVNHLVLRDVFGLDSVDSLLGRTDLEFQPPALAEAYHAEDQRVIESGKILSGQVWLVPHVAGSPKWYVSTKTPLFGLDGHTVGLAGVMYAVETPKDREAYFRELAPVIAHIENHFSETISMSEMAAMVGLSSTRFNLRFRQILHMSPSTYQLRLRIESAQRMLTGTENSVASIALDCGFCDQSHFGKRFQKATGMTPKAYRSKFR